jgi:7,8-dihydropterin-6-yl-methyl-4-(beta-D-ribofuranosyl)aminobenzene 5'-phosphate synthase
MAPLTELDALEVLVIVDNEVDPMSTYQNPALKVSGQLLEMGMTSPFAAPGRGDSVKELRMESICHGAHGLSLMIVSDFDFCPHTALDSFRVLRPP